MRAERTWRTVRAQSGRADGWTGGREDGRTGPTRGGHADGQKRRGQGPARMDGRRSGQAVGQTGGLGGRGRKSRGRADSADGRTGGWVDEWVGLGLKGHIPRGWVHSWAPSLLASLERKCAGCLGVQWGPVRFHVKHPYLALELTCLI